MQCAAHEYAVLYVSQLKAADDPSDLWRLEQEPDTGHNTLSKNLQWLLPREAQTKVSPEAGRQGCRRLHIHNQVLITGLLRRLGNLLSFAG